MAQDVLSKTFIPYSDTSYKVHSTYKQSVYQIPISINEAADTSGLIKKFDKNTFKFKDGILEIAPVIDIVGGASIAKTGLGLSARFNYKNIFFVNVSGVSENIQSPDYVNNLFSARGVFYGERMAYNTNLGLGYKRLNYSITYKPSRFLTLELGQGKHFIGDGYRSLLLSENAANYPYFKTETNIWHLKYINIWNEMKSFDDLNSKYYSKYSVVHYLSWNISKRVNIGLFESMIWERRDSSGVRGFEVNYMNPIIFYHPVGFALGSPDNSSLGLTFKVKVARKNLIYGQVFIDDLIVGELKQDVKHFFNPKDDKINYGYWTNKQAFQIGWKSLDVFHIKGLMVQNEINVARPYTYSHRDPVLNYSNYYQSLADPLGSNYAEMVNFAKYKMGRFLFEYELMYAKVGMDSTGQHLGNNIFLSTYDTYDPKRPNILAKQYKNYVGQGINTKIFFTGIKVCYMIYPPQNLRVELGVYHRQLKSRLTSENANYIYIGIRTSLESLAFDF